MAGNACAVGRQNHVGAFKKRPPVGLKKYMDTAATQHTQSGIICAEGATTLPILVIRIMVVEG